MNTNTQAVPLQLQLDIPLMKKRISVNVNPRNSIKQLLILFSQKLDIDYSSYTIVAKLKREKDRIRIPTDIPLSFALEDVSVQPVVIEIGFSYD